MLYRSSHLKKKLRSSKFRKTHRKTRAGVSFSDQQHVFFQRLQHRCFEVSFTKFLRASFFTKHLQTVASDFLWITHSYRVHDYFKAKLLWVFSVFCARESSFSTYQGVRHVSLFETFAKFLNEWSPTSNTGRTILTISFK